MNELLFHSGRVRTFDPAQPFAEAVAVRGDTIVAVGDVGDVRREVSPRAESVDLSGGLLIPGIRDAHVHPVHGGIDLLSCDLSGVTMDAQAYVAAVARYAAERPELPWITGGGWSMTAFPGGTPRADLLDVAVLNRPCYLVNTDRHGAWVNTNALRLAGLDRDVTDPSDGRIERDRDGAPTGTLHEGAARLVGDLTPPLGADDCLAALLIAQRHLHALGITGWQDAIVGEYLGYPDNFEAYRTLDARGDLTASVTGALWWDRTLGTEQIPTLVERRALAESCDRFRATSVKIMVDGVVETQTASMLEPYGGGHHPGSSGTPFIEREALASAVAVLDSAGFQVHLHTIGDRAVRDALDAIGALPDPRRGRHQLAHTKSSIPPTFPGSVLSVWWPTCRCCGRPTNRR